MIGLNIDLLEREKQGNPVRVGLIGCGQMGIDVVATTRMMQGIRIVAVADIDEARAKSAFAIAQIEGQVVKAASADEADAAVAAGKLVYATDYRVITDMKTVKVMLESTGVPDVGARAAIRSAFNGQQLAMMNVETDITVGPLVNAYAKQKGVLYALAAGDEPAACKELYDFAVSCGFTVVAAGKGKNNPLDRHAKPTDEKWMKEAARRGLNPNMLIEFVDGSKTMIEMASVSNATGLIPDVRGMHGPITHREILNKTFALQKDGGILSRTGVVDYGIGGVHPGVFMIITTDHPRLRQALVYRDMGNGPYYTLFRPYHLCSIEVPLTCAMLEIRRKSNMAPLDRLVAEVFAVAKKELQPGEILDGIGGSAFYSSIDLYPVSQAERLLPVGLAKHAVVQRKIAVDQPITLDDVVVHRPSTIFDLRQLQDDWMTGKQTLAEVTAQMDRLAVQ
ncbi:MAG: NAD(P)-dependent oxidoreductase [Calditrichaeota bacterium]|nr:MAG: NAD(P)-dependent oxidoreductase [Calditrichota bacterium]